MIEFKKRGISLVVLMATVTVLVILITTVTISGIASSNNAKKITFATELSNIQEGIDTYKLKNAGDYPAGDIISVDLSNVSDTDKQQFNAEKIIDNRVNLYAVDYTKINITSLKYGNKSDGNTDIYALSQDSGKVYYVKGLNVGANTYFALTDDLKKMINYSTNVSNSNVDDGIIFTASETKWTNKVVSVNIKIPKKYINVAVKVDGTGDFSPTSTDDPTYNIYDVNNIGGSYQINVSYKLNSSDTLKETKYDVSNVDLIPPVITLDSNNQKLVKASDSSSAYAYVSILSKSDDLSGIKVIKYESENIDNDQIEAYFKSNGKVVNSDSIPIEKKAMYVTVYIEDNAGNWTANHITVDSQIYSGLL